MSKREGELKSRFRQELLRQLPGFYMLQYATSGAPDREIVGCSITSRWEMKHATPRFVSHSDQELMCCRLAVVAHCRYVIWHEYHGIQRTLIVHPLQVMHRVGWDLQAEAWCAGFDMEWLVRQIHEVHQCK